MDCEYRGSKSSSWLQFDPSNYYDGYAECNNWIKGNPGYTIKLTLNGNVYTTNEDDAIGNGAHPSAGIIYILEINSIKDKEITSN